MEDMAMEKKNAKKESGKGKKKCTYRDALRGRKLNKIGEYLLTHDPIEVEYADMRAIMK